MWKTALAMTVFLTSCATAPSLHDYQKTWTMPCSFDRAWSATIELFADRGWPIATLEKDSGIIVSDWVNIGTQSGYADCGKPGIAIVQRREAKFNVFVRDKVSGTSLTVNTNFRELRSYNNQTFYQDCTSMGVLEANVHRQILAKVR